MQSLGFQLLLGFANLTIGLALGWYACRSRHAHKEKALPSSPPAGDAVTNLLDEIRDTMSDQVDTWDTLQQLIAASPDLSPEDLGMHVRANRLYGRLLKSYGDQLSHYDPEGQIVPHQVTDNVAASRSDVGTLTAVLEELETHPDEAGLRNLAARLSELESSNRTLREELLKAQSKISEQTVRLQDAVSQAMRDHLTELPNRRSFDERLKELHSMLQRHETPFCLLMIDLDHFKRLNDTYGHDTGDSVLRVAAHVMAEACRYEDVLFRYGGEEFAVLAPQTDLAGAAELAERIRKNVEKASVNFHGNAIKFTCSVGLAEAHAGDSRDELIRNADEALYVAKNAGRNVIHVAQVPIRAETSATPEPVPAPLG